MQTPRRPPTEGGKRETCLLPKGKGMHFLIDAKGCVQTKARPGGRPPRTHLCRETPVMKLKGLGEALHPETAFPQPGQRPDNVGSDQRLLQT